MKVGSLCSEAFVSEPFLQRKNILWSVHEREARKELGMENCRRGKGGRTELPNENGL